jgi:hypothetical protein
MHTRTLALATATILGWTCISAAAVLDLFWVRNPITQTAINADPTGVLGSSQSWSLKITFEGVYWDFAAIRLTLPPASAYYNTSPSRGGGPFRANPAMLATYPDLAFDTYVTGPHQLPSGARVPALFGGWPDIKTPISFGGPLDPIPGTVSVAWGYPEAVNYPTPAGTYELLRATFPLGALPTVHPASRVDTRTFGQFAFIPQIPEPRGFVAVVAVAWSYVLRRRSRSSVAVEWR